jgi:signal transduction histidine kinase
MAFQIMMLLANCKRVGRLVAVLVGLTFTAAWAAPDPKLNLSEAETRWLAAHPVVRIGVDPAYAPYAFIDERGRFRGVAADFTDTIAAMLGIRMERVPLRTWADVLEAAQEQRIDVVTPAVRLPERDVYLNFSRIYIPTPLVIVTRSDSPKIEGPDDLRALAVALVNGYSSTLQVRQRYPDMNVHLVESPLDGLRAVSGGEVDAYVGVLGVSSRLASRHGLTNLQVNAGYEMSENGQRFGVRKDWPELVALLDKALAAIPDEDKAAIFQRWVPVLLETRAEARLALTDAEKAWIATQPAIRVGVESTQPPFQFLNAQGRPAGMVADYLELIADRSGLRFEMVAEADSQRLLERARSGGIDVIAAPRREDGIMTGFNLTRPYYTSPLMVIVRRDDADGFGGDVRSLYGRRVAVRQGSHAEDFLRAYPKVQILGVESVAAALQAVAERRADAVVGEAGHALRVLENSGLTGLRAEAPLERSEVAFRLAVRADWPNLASILNKTAASITPEEAAGIRRRWVGVPLEVGWNPRTVALWVLLAVAATALGYALVLRQNRRLAREIEKRRAAEEEAQRNSKELETFAYAISHDLKAPLRRIAGFSHILADDHAAQLDAEGRGFLGRIEAGAAKMDRMVDDLLAYSRMESRRIGRDRIVLAPLLRELVEDRGGDEQYAATDIRLEVPEDLIVLADRDGLAQVLRNLIDNALKYSRKASSPVVEIGGRREKDACLLWVRDNGTGFDMAQHDKIFEIFQRAHGETEFPGTGVGLALVRRCVQRMGGRVWAESAPGQGATFHVELPA